MLVELVVFGCSGWSWHMFGEVAVIGLYMVAVPGDCGCARVSAPLCFAVNCTFFTAPRATSMVFIGLAGVLYKYIDVPMRDSRGVMTDIDAFLSGHCCYVMTSRRMGAEYFVSMYVANSGTYAIVWGDSFCFFVVAIGYFRGFLVEFGLYFFTRSRGSSSLSVWLFSIRASCGDSRT